MIYFLTTGSRPVFHGYWAHTINLISNIAFVVSLVKVFSKNGLFFSHVVHLYHKNKYKKKTLIYLCQLFNYISI